MTTGRMSADDRRRSIADAARTLFARDGYEATTTRAIAKQADVSDALLYRHFADKRAVLVRVVDEAMTVFGGLPPLERLRDASMDALLRTLGGGFMERAEANLDALVLLLTEHRAIGDARFAAFIHDAATALGLDLARREPHLDAGSGYLIARSFFGSLVAFVLLQRVLGLDAVERIDSRRYLDQVVRTTVAGLAEGATSDGSVAAS